MASSKKEGRLEVWLFTIEERMKRGCFDCGYNKHFAALDFHHMEDKRKNVSDCRTLDEAQIEIDKCIVLCANCHRIRHQHVAAIDPKTDLVLE